MGSPGKQTGSATLSARERECLILIPELGTSKAIAQRIGLQPGTVDGYVKSAMRKLGAGDRFEAARMLGAISRGDVPPEIGAPQISGMAGPATAMRASASHGEEVAVPSEFREAPASFGGGVEPNRPEGRVNLTQLGRREGKRNNLGGWQRVGIGMVILIAAVLALFILTGALLAISAARREIGT